MKEYFNFIKINTDTFGEKFFNEENIQQVIKRFYQKHPDLSFNDLNIDLNEIAFNSTGIDFNILNVDGDIVDNNQDFFEDYFKINNLDELKTLFNKININYLVGYKKDNDNNIEFTSNIDIINELNNAGLNKVDSIMNSINLLKNKNENNIDLFNKIDIIIIK